MKGILPPVLLVLATGVLLLGYPSLPISAAPPKAPAFVISNVQIDGVYSSSARLVIEANAFNPYDFPTDLDLALQVKAPNNPDDTELLSFDPLSAIDFEPQGWDRDFTTNGNMVRLYAGRYHALRFWGNLSTEIPAKLRPDGRSDLFPYLYDYGASLGLQAPAGVVNFTLVGEANFVREGQVVYTMPVYETIKVSYPFKY